MAADPGDAWREQRQRAVEAHAKAQRDTKEARTRQAREQIAAFLRAAADRGLRPGALTAPAFNGGRRYRTNLRGWYINKARTLAVGADGEFYVLGVPNSIRAAVFGAHVEPQPPPLIVGEGGRDGEAIAHQELLERRHAAAD
jgi:hypothetical protein